MFKRTISSTAKFVGDTLYMVLHEFRRWAVPILVALLLLAMGAIIYRETGIDIKELLEK